MLYIVSIAVHDKNESLIMTKKSNVLARSCLAVGLILTGLFAIVGSINAYRTVLVIKSLDGGMFSNIDKIIPVIPATVTAKERLVVKTLHTDKNKDYSAAKELHEAYPADKIYLANYIINSVVFEKVATESQIETDSQKMLKKLNYAEKIDPKNALYNYLKASILFSGALVLERSKNKVFGYRDHKIVDQKKLNLALNEFQKGLAKPYYRTYTFDLMKQRVKILMPNPVSFDDHIQKITIEANTMLPYLGIMRNLTRQVRTAIIYNYNQKKYQECEKLINTWKPFTQQQLNDSDFLISYLVTKAISGIYLDTASKYYHERKNKKLAAYYDKKIAINKVRPNKKGTCDFKLSHNRIGFLGGWLLPAISIFETQEDLNAKLYPDNIVGYKLIEQFFVAGLSVFLFFIILVYALVQGFSKNDAQYIKFNNKELLLIIGAGLIAPLAIYLTITNIDVLSGREFSLAFNRPKIIPQLILLIASVILPLNIAMKYIVRKHCLKDGIAISKGKISLWTMMVFYLLLIVTATIGVSFIQLDWKSFVNWCIDQTWLYRYPVNGILALTLIVGFILLLVCTVWYFIDLEKYKSFRELFNKNFTPYLAVLPIILLLTLFTIFKYQEYYYIEKDEVVFAKAENGEYFTPLEYRATEKLKELYKKEILDK